MDVSEYRWLLLTQANDTQVSDFCIENNIKYSTAQAGDRVYYIIYMADEDALVLKVLMPDLKKIK